MITFDDIYDVPNIVYFHAYIPTTIYILHIVRVVLNAKLSHLVRSAKISPACIFHFNRMQLINIRSI